jgi:hypothetical protein
VSAVQAPRPAQPPPRASADSAQQTTSDLEVKDLKYTSAYINLDLSISKYESMARQPDAFHD